MKTKTMLHDSPLQEAADTMQAVLAHCGPYAGLSYFADLVRSHFAPEQGEKLVTVLGPDFPEALIYAAGAVPYWVMGGSPCAAALAGDLVPRDTDPVSRAMLGCLRDPRMAWLRRTLVLVPVTNDSSRKLAYLLRQDGYRVHTVDFPPFKGPEAARSWARQMERCSDALAAYTGKRPSRAGVRKASQTLAACREQARRLLALPGVEPECRMLVLFSYYCTGDPADWAARLSLLCDELERDGASPSGEKPRILLMGSPAYFPNYKLPLLLREAGLDAALCLDVAVQKLRAMTGSAGPLAAFFAADCSGACAVNERLLAAAESAMSELPLDGVVCHILKGQIEYDFELPRAERLAERYGLPVFRLETDYNPQDVEQLRVRLEAFREMLTQNRRRGKEGAP